MLGLNSQFSEIIWFYPSRDSSEVDRYVIYNFSQNCWYDGNLSRTVWEDMGVFDRPLALNPDGTLFSHENGNDADGQAMSAFIETSERDIKDGNSILFIDRFIQDFNLTPQKPVQVTLYIRKYPRTKLY